jgi:hypothetical protein
MESSFAQLTHSEKILHTGTNAPRAAIQRAVLIFTRYSTASFTKRLWMAKHGVNFTWRCRLVVLCGIARICSMLNRFFSHRLYVPHSEQLMFNCFFGHNAWLTENMVTMVTGAWLSETKGVARSHHGYYLHRHKANACSVVSQAHF